MDKSYTEICGEKYSDSEVCFLCGQAVPLSTFPQSWIDIQVKDENLTFLKRYWKSFKFVIFAKLLFETIFRIFIATLSFYVA